MNTNQNHRGPAPAQPQGCPDTEPKAQAGGDGVRKLVNLGYVVQSMPDRHVNVHSNGGVWVARPLITLKDSLGGVAHVVLDDDCYVLVTGSYEHGFIIATHWFIEALRALVAATAVVTVRIA